MLLCIGYHCGALCVSHKGVGYEAAGSSPDWRVPVWSSPNDQVVQSSPSPDFDQVVQSSPSPDLVPYPSGVK